MVPIRAASIFRLPGAPLAPCLQFRLRRASVWAVLVALGPELTSYMQFFPQATVIEKGVTARELRLTRADVVISAIFADLVAFLFVVTNAQTLHPAGIRIDTAADAARALEPLAGPYAQALFAIGLIGASLLAASVLRFRPRTSGFGG